MLHVVTCLWDANKNSKEFSRCYNEVWAEKLYRGFKRHLTRPFRFVVFSERKREFNEPIEHERLSTDEPDYGSFTEPYRLNEPMILVGLDTLVVGNIDHFADYCLSAKRIALPRNPYKLEQSINGVALVPAGQRHVYDGWHGENDMDWMRKQDTAFIDDLWPGEVLSLKAHKVRDLGLQDARIVYFHGRPKMDELKQFLFLQEHWV